MNKQHKNAKFSDVERSDQTYSHRPQHKCAAETWKGEKKFWQNTEGFGKGGEFDQSWNTVGSNWILGSWWDSSRLFYKFYGIV